MKACMLRYFCKACRTVTKSAISVSVKVWAKMWYLGLVNFVAAVAYHFCPNLPENSRYLGTTI